jgi:hypothetical protein
VTFEKNPGCNWYIDPETEVRKVYRKWVEDGSNLTLYGSHANMGVGIKDDNCYDPTEIWNHEDCLNHSDCDYTRAKGHTFDERGFYVDMQPVERPQTSLTTLDVRVEHFRRLRQMSEEVQLPNWGAQDTEEDHSVDEVHQAHLRAFREYQRRYFTYPVHTMRQPDGTVARTRESE